jgi:hypothetical protein
MTTAYMGDSLDLTEARPRLARILYRVSAVLFILFALGHTFGFLTLKPPTTEAIAVRDAMQNVHFQIRGVTLSYGGFYMGFGLTISAYLFFSSILAWASLWPHRASTRGHRNPGVGLLRPATRRPRTKLDLFRRRARDLLRLDGSLSRFGRIHGPLNTGFQNPLE